MIYNEMREKEKTDRRDWRYDTKSHNLLFCLGVCSVVYTVSGNKLSLTHYVTNIGNS